MEIQINVVSCGKFWIHWVGVNHKIYSRHVVNLVFTPTQWIQNLQHDSTYTWKPIKDFDLNGT